MEEPEEYIDFMVKYKDWISIKKLGIHPTSTPQDVVYHLAAIRATIDNHAYSFLGIKTTMLDAFAAEAMKGTRKSPSALATAGAKFAEPSARQVIESSCSDKKLMPLAEIYLLSKLVSSSGYDISINQTVMSKIFPELKPPKAMGRMGKKKKAEEEPA